MRRVSKWSVHVAAMAADVVPLGGGALAGVDADSLCAARLRMMPGFALHGSVWPIADIWLEHPPGACIGDAWAGAALHERDFNLAAAIERSITSGWLVALHAREQEN